MQTKRVKKEENIDNGDMDHVWFGCMNNQNENFWSLKWVFWTHLKHHVGAGRVGPTHLNANGWLHPSLSCKDKTLRTKVCLLKTIWVCIFTLPVKHVGSPEMHVNACWVFRKHTFRTALVMGVKPLTTDLTCLGTAGKWGLIPKGIKNSTRRWSCYTVFFCLMFLHLLALV